jgi:hypothetical protein
MNINLEQDWIKFESLGATAYYGYTTPGTSDSSSSWAIRQVLGTGPSMAVAWNDNTLLSYSAAWDERYDCFIAPTASLGLTWSVVNSTNSFNITSALINLSWDDLVGVNSYTLLVSDQDGVIYNYLSQPFANTYATPMTTQQTGTSYLFIGVPSMTYSVTVTAINAAGSTQSSADITT